jgi:putative SOS response-associated peptidase YedK
MCGRFVATAPLTKVAEYFGAESPGFALRPNFNVSPTTVVAGVALSANRRHIDRFVWGLVPKWQKTRGHMAPLINARAESVVVKPSFRHLVPAHRCIVPMDGYYEWMTTKESQLKIPYYITRVDEAPVAVAGLWEEGDESTNGLPRLCIITVAANDKLAAIHDRMPAILQPSEVEDWLEGDVPEALHALHPSSEHLLGAREVSTRVNSVRNNDPSNIEEVETQLPPSLFD